jgi:apolipoprotein N-acyltransferase
MKKQWLLLIPGIICLYFSNGRFATPLAAWLFPLFLLSVSRHRNSRFTGLIFPLVVGITLQAAFWNFTSSNQSSILFYIPFFAGFLYGFVFFADRLLYRQSSSFAATLFFPLMYTVVDFGNGLFNPFGTTGVLGYSQFGFLPFAQLASITGMWGLTFVITWFGSVLHWGLTNPIHKTKKGIGVYSFTLFAILVFGFIRLSIPLNSNTVKVAGLHTTDKERDGKAFWEALAKKDTLSFNKASIDQITNLTTATTEQAHKGARVVLWSEVSPVILKSKEDILKTYLADLAASLKIYLIANPYVATIDDTKPENKIWMFSPKGELIFTHYKYGGNFIEGSVEGDKKLKTVSTPHGIISGVICWDADFPSVIKQTGKLKADIVFNPASDWSEIDPIHTSVAVFRAIENGCSWVRQTRNGLSIITDPRGKTISRMDHFEQISWINTGDVPTKKLPTFYPIIGDLFGWLALTGLLSLLLFYFIKRK